MMSTTPSHSELPLACHPQGIPTDKRERHGMTAMSLFAAVQEMQALPNGYTFRLPTTSALMLSAAEYVTNERLCCPFFNFALEIEANGGSFWLRLTGGEGVKEFIEAEFPRVLNPTIVEAAGLQ